MPLGIVALFWLRLYLPLLRQDIPQNPDNTARFERLRFAKQPLVELGDISPVDLGAGVGIGADRRLAMDGALRDACRNHQGHAGQAPDLLRWQSHFSGHETVQEDRLGT